jgi:hypothetical protein
MVSFAFAVITMTFAPFHGFMALPPLKKAGGRLLPTRRVNGLQPLVLLLQRFLHGLVLANDPSRTGPLHSPVARIHPATTWGPRSGLVCDGALRRSL